MKHRQQVQPVFVLGFHIFNKWMKLKNEGKSLQKFFDDNCIKTVAVYGIGALGERLCEDLRQLKVELCYGIDKDATNKCSKRLRIVTPDDELEPVDAIIVTPVQAFYEIEAELEKRIHTDIISLEDLVEYCI